jgi:hypothetical protein
MQQLFHTRNYSIRDFEEWNDRGELMLQPKFQRRDVWSVNVGSRFRTIENGSGSTLRYIAALGPSRG